MCTTSSITGTSISTPHHRGQRGAGVKAKQADGSGHGQFKEIGRANQRRGAGHAVLFAHCAVKPVGQPCVKEHLDENAARPAGQ